MWYPDFLTDQRNKVIPISQEELFPHLASLIKMGNIVAIKNTSGYLLCCDAANEEAISEAKTKKTRAEQTLCHTVSFPQLLEQDLFVSEDEKMNSQRFKARSS
ncbi:MAG: Sua5/YciO/YrdC/YwlC family protein [Marinilabiliales bacterium]|nr:Sua5/YciO/YrdC/YwlC family protein [Marinilabiliales bacterium]